jgi:hypothetical protein
MFTVERREQVRMQLLGRAREDERIVAPPSPVQLLATPRTGGPTSISFSGWRTVFRFTKHCGTGDLLEVDLAFTPVDEFGPVGNGGFRSSSVVDALEPPLPDLAAD